MLMGGLDTTGEELMIPNEGGGGGGGEEAGEKLAQIGVERVTGGSH